MKILLTTELAIQFSDNEDLVKIMNMPQKENSSFERSYITETPARKPSKNFTVLRNLKYSSINNSCLSNKSHYVIIKTNVMSSIL